MLLLAFSQVFVDIDNIIRLQGGCGFGGFEFIYAECPSSKQVRYHIVTGADHTKVFGDDFNLDEVIWQFFKTY